MSDKRKHYKYKCSNCAGIVHVSTRLTILGFETYIKRCDKCDKQHEFNEVYEKLERLEN